MAALQEKEKKRITENPTMEEENPNRKMAEMLHAEGKINKSILIQKTKCFRIIYGCNKI